MGKEKKTASYESRLIMAAQAAGYSLFAFKSAASLGDELTLDVIANALIHQAIYMEFKDEFVSE